MSVPQLEDLGDVDGRRVLLRADFNVPIADGEITDDLRIRAARPTIEWLQEHGAHVTACTHLGRPKGKPDPKYSVEPVRARLAELAPGVELLENLRYDAGEEGNDPAFVQSLIKGFDVRQRPSAHRTAPTHRTVGRLHTTWALGEGGRGAARPANPAPVHRGARRRQDSDKLGVVEALLDVVDSLAIGGSDVLHVPRRAGLRIGDCCSSPTGRHLRADPRQRKGEGAPARHITALGPNGEVRQLGVDIPPGWKGLDIGPGSAAEFSDVVLDARTVFWNGPMGMFEDERFAAGTRTVAQAMADTKAFTVVGGGDSAAALAQFGLDDEVDHVSTGGGASLELLEYGDLPGLEALRSAPKA
jgi:phosphoglycerate kinase